MDTSQINESMNLPNEHLQKLDEGEAVHFLQKGLQVIGYDVEVTDYFDSDTVLAITDLQLQVEPLLVSGMYDAKTKQVMQQIVAGELAIQPASVLAKQTKRTIDDDTIIINNPYDVLALINKQHALPADYEPFDLIYPQIPFTFEEKLARRQMRVVAARALEDMFAQADGAGLHLLALSGYRSYDRQDKIFRANAERVGVEAANNFSARPGESEHQSGLAMDVTTPSVDNKLVIAFGETKEGQWVKEHASNFGFIIRYPEGKEHLTQYQYEPWHLRYVGKKAAKTIMQKEIILEQYFNVL